MVDYNRFKNHRLTILKTLNTGFHIEAADIIVYVSADGILVFKGLRNEAYNSNTLF